MKNKKGFTLIELLAIIVILAVIAVITVPLILGIIDEAKQKASESSAYGYKDAVEKNYITKMISGNEQYLNGTYTVSNGKLNNQEIPISGTTPSNGTLTYENNKLVSGCLTIDGYKVQYQNDKFTATKGNCEDSSTVYYTYDPNAEESEEGYITNKQSSIDPNWKIYIKESIQPIQGYTVFSKIIFNGDEALEFDTYDECVAEKQNTEDPDYIVSECIKPYTVKYIMDGQTGYDLHFLDNQKCVSKLNEIPSETVEQMQAQCDEAPFYVITKSAYYADTSPDGFFETLESCENFMNENVSSSEEMFNECRPYEKLDKKVYQICMVEDGNTRCFSNDGFENNNGLLNSMFDDCAYSGEFMDSYRCYGNDIKIKTYADSNSIGLYNSECNENVCEFHEYCSLSEYGPYCYSGESTFGSYPVINTTQVGNPVAYFSSSLSGYINFSDYRNVEKIIRVSSIKKTDIDSERGIKNFMNLSDSSLSNVPIYFFRTIDNRKIYWYSQAQNPKFSQGTSLYGFFANTRLTDVSGIADWDVSDVTNFSRMFYNTRYLNDISSIGWVIKNSESSNFEGMFLDSGVVTSGKYPTFYSDDNKTQVINGTWNNGTFTPAS